MFSILKFIGSILAERPIDQTRSEFHFGLEFLSKLHSAHSQIKFEQVASHSQIKFEQVFNGPIDGIMDLTISIDSPNQKVKTFKCAYEV